MAVQSGTAVEPFAKIVSTASVVTHGRASGSLQFAWPIETIRSWLFQSANVRLIRSLAPQSTMDVRFITYSTGQKPSIRFHADETWTHEVSVTLDQSDRNAIVLILDKHVARDMKRANDLQRAFNRCVYVHPEQLLTVRLSDGSALTVMSARPVIDRDLIACLDKCRSLANTQVIAFRLQQRLHGRVVQERLLKPLCVRRDDSLKVLATKEVATFIKQEPHYASREGAAA